MIRTQVRELERDSGRNVPLRRLVNRLLGGGPCPRCGRKWDNAFNFCGDCGAGLQNFVDLTGDASPHRSSGSPAAPATAAPSSSSSFSATQLEKMEEDIEEMEKDIDVHYASLDELPYWRVLNYLEPLEGELAEKIKEYHNTLALHPGSHSRMRFSSEKMSWTRRRVRNFDDAKAKKAAAKRKSSGASSKKKKKRLKRRSNSDSESERHDLCSIGTH